MSFSHARLMRSLFALLSLLMLTTLTLARDYVVPDAPLNVMYNGKLQYGFVEFSTDGRYAAVTSRQTQHVFFYDRLSDLTELVSVDNQGQPMDAADHNSYPPAYVSDDGRYVTFERASIENNENVGRIYIRDRMMNKTREITLNSAGQPFTNATFGYPQMTPNGRYIVYYGGGEEMPDGFTKLCAEAIWSDYCSAVFVYNLQTKETTRVSLNSNGQPANGNSAFATISDNGRYIAFVSDSTNLGGTGGLCGDDEEPYPCWYLYLHDRQLGTTRHITGIDGNPLAEIHVPITLWGFNLSGNGRYLVYSYDLDWEFESPIPYQVFVYDTLLDTTETLVLKNSSDEAVDTVLLGAIAVSDDGRFVVLQGSDDPEYVLGDVRVYDRVTDTAVPLLDTIGDLTNSKVAFDAVPQPLGMSGDGSLIGYWTSDGLGDGSSERIVLAQGQSFAPAPYTEVELVKNGGAETQGVMTKMPENWNITDYRAARRRCDYLPNTGSCVLQIKPVKNKIVRLTQSVPAVNNPGDTLNFSASVRGFNVSRATVRVLVNYADGTTEFIKIPSASLNGTYNYKQVTANLTLDKLAYSIKVQMYIHNRGTGKLLVDDVSLIMGSGEPEALNMIPVPEAPILDNLPGRTTN